MRHATKQKRDREAGAVGEKSVEMHVLGDRMLSVGQKLARKFRWSKKFLVRGDFGIGPCNEDFREQGGQLLPISVTPS